MHTTILLSPSGKRFEVREQNGADDEILSSIASDRKKLLETIHKFMASVVLKVDGAPVTIDTIRNLRLRDKYYLLIACRMFSLGEKLKFDFPWMKDYPPTEYEEDLGQFIWDYSKPFPKPGDREYNNQRIAPYPEGQTEIEVHIKGETYVLDFMDGVGELEILSCDVIHANTELVARNISVREAGVRKPIKNFAEIPSRDLVAIRAAVDEVDYIPTADITIHSPYSGESQVISLLSIRDFFFPTRL